MSMSDPAVEDYTIGWICALQEEYEAACRMLDCETDGPETAEGNDNNTYAFGRISRHYMVIGSLPGGQYGTNSAASVARDMVRSFPNLRFALMVGIAGAAPTKERDIRLGDVVVSEPQVRLGGVVQYDLGKRLPDGRFQPTGQLNAPPLVLLGALPEMRRRHRDPRKPDRIAEHLKLMDDMPDYRRPADDRLYRADYEHKGGKTCEACAANGLVERAPRKLLDREVDVHYGTIASGNSVMKDAKERDRYSQDPELNILAFEMEASGLMNNFPCLVIRGICDYSDSHKNDDWHKYAALTAAAYARELLHVVKPTKVAQLPSWLGKIESLLADIQNGVSDVARNTDNIVDHHHKTEAEKILDWLTPVDYGPQQSAYLNRRQPGTGQWLLDSQEYKTWLSASKQTLFCPGIPGAGKTILASIVIADLIERFRDDPTVGIAYLYCNFREGDTQNAANLLASLLKQLCHPTPPDNIKALYKRHKENRTMPLFDEISSTLQSVTAIYSRVFIVIDALDECQASDGCRSRFLSQIFSLQAKTNMNLLATSRHLPEIESEFEGSTQLEIRASDGDVRKYLQDHMFRLPGFVRRSPQLQEEVKTEIVQSVQGMFLLARLHLDSLVGKKSPQAVRDALTQLPTGSSAYDKAYDDAMDRIEGQVKDQEELAKQTLSWITCAKRPLTTLELRHALAVKEGRTELREDNISDVEDIVSVCAGLVTVDEQSGIIRLVHYTTQEYFERTQARWFPNAEEDITKICVTYLSLSAFGTGLCESEDEFNKERLAFNPLYDYAAHNWGNHARKTHKCDQSVIDFLRDLNKVEASVQALKGFRGRGSLAGVYSRSCLRHATGLHLAAHFGLHAAVISLLRPWQDIDLEDSWGRTPLSWAAENGQKAVVQLLLEEGAHVDAEDENGWTPLIYAIRSGHKAAVQLLLEEGVDHEDDGGDPLICAVSERDDALVKLLLEKGASLKFRDFEGRTALLHAAGDGLGGIVQQLLENGADIEARDEYDQTPLSCAIESKHGAVIKLLLEKGAKLESKDATYAMYQAYEVGHESTVKMLLEKLDSPDSIKTEAGDPLLFLAAALGLEETTKMLLDRGTNIESRDTGCGRTPLSVAASGGCEAVVKILLAKGADLECRDEIYGQTPLSWATEAGEVDVVRLLLENGAVVEAKDKDKRTPLSWAAEAGEVDVVRLLLENGAFVEAKDKHGRTPLWYAEMCGFETVAKLLKSAK